MIRSLYISISRSRACRWLLAFLLLPAAGCLTACRHEPDPAEQTVLMYFPYTENLQAAFSTNIAEMAQVVMERGGLGNSQLLIYMASSPSEGKLWRLSLQDGNIHYDLLEHYTDANYLSVAFMARIFSRVKQAAPAHRYGLIIGAHGLGWVSSDDYAAASAHSPSHLSVQYPLTSSPSPLTSQLSTLNSQLSTDQTRFFGGMTDGHRCEISALAEAMHQADYRTEYLLFDACSMAAVEVAYELRFQTRFLIGSTSEIMGYGMPYATMGSHLLGQPNYKAAADAFLSFYSSYQQPCGTLAVIDCSHMDDLADLTARLTHNRQPVLPVDSLQALDGYNPPIFFDYASYLHSFPLSDAETLSLDSLLALAVPYAVHTDSYYSSLTKRRHPIRTFSGITISAPSLSPYMSGYTFTSWYAATHR